jgi:hypothetical protein
VRCSLEVLDEEEGSAVEGAGGDEGAGEDEAENEEDGLEAEDCALPSLLSISH